MIGIREVRDSLLAGALAAAGGAWGCGAATPDAHQVYAPELELGAIDGRRVRLSDHVGKDAVLLTFWETRCTPCLRQLGVFQELYEDYRESGLVVLAVSIDGPRTRGAVLAAAERWEVTYPILLDEDTTAISRYNPKMTLPYTLLIDRNGRVVMRLIGRYAPRREMWLDRAVERALSPIPGVEEPELTTGDEQPWQAR